jgi:hypothetical protein
MALNFGEVSCAAGNMYWDDIEYVTETETLENFQASKIVRIQGIES